MDQDDTRELDLTDKVISSPVLSCAILHPFYYTQFKLSLFTPSNTIRVIRFNVMMNKEISDFSVTALLTC